MNAKPHFEQPQEVSDDSMKALLKQNMNAVNLKPLCQLAEVTQMTAVSRLHVLEKIQENQGGLYK